jgi:2',3'-cyclic-nucleotide 2'-phosphodiesterase/3'-nucleotidase
MTKTLRIILAGLLAVACSARVDGDYQLHVLTTNDIHGTYFDSTYVDGGTQNSLLAAYYYVDSVRTAVGPENVVLLDAGDFLQGNNAAYYYNYVETGVPHVFSRMVSYMGYDAVTWGNHDVEPGHAVYDRVSKEIEGFGIPFLGGNSIREDDGKPYFPVYTILKKNGLKVAVLGFNNANIKAWLDEDIWSGMRFESLIPLVQQDVDKVIAKEKPHIVVVCVHSGTGDGDGTVLESQGLDLYKSLKGVDVLVCAHDHRPFVTGNGTITLLNSGSHSRNLGHGVVTLSVKKGKVVSKSVEGGLIPIRKEKADPQMREAFQKDYEAVKAFTLREVGELKTDLNLSDAFAGMSDYLNLLHTVSLGCEPAQISVAAPLNQRGLIKAGKLVFNDLFTLYQYENQLFVVKMSGKEVKDYLEASYDLWIRTADKPGDRVLNIHNVPDTRTGLERWSFVNASFNFDSMGGINYTVDVTKPYGRRINISSMADGGAFDMDATYNVAMTSYRASGGGGTMDKIGIDTDRIDERVVRKYPEIRNMIYDYLKEHGSIDPAEVGDPAVIGHWEFVPAPVAGPGIARDMRLLFGE